MVRALIFLNFVLDLALAKNLFVFIRHFDANPVSIDVGNDPIGTGNDDHAGVASGLCFQSGTHKGTFGTQQGNRLSLHIRTHEGAVSVVVFEEGNQGSCHRDNLDGGNTNVVHLFGGSGGEFLPIAHGDSFAEDITIFIGGHVSRCYPQIVFFVGGEVFNGEIIAYSAIFHRITGGFNKTVVVDASVGGQGTD